MPLHLNDDDIVSVHGEILKHPRSEFTMLSYTVHVLELAGIMREVNNLATPDMAQGRKRLNLQYKHTIGLTAMGPIATIPVQRFILHQQLQSLLLHLHCFNLLTPMGRSLTTSNTQLFNATIVLLLRLLFHARSADADPSSAQLSRLMTRE
ncbi:putative C6 transcription factor [Aspergillus tanneri]|uniref:Uncharacterized protein n=1 Tax=Aspergillus tanneri TaxID=1220188 RepID=A0A5M9MIR7_9EURO|nr:uncharacterized protein ATNIH1004_006659 [Aspergillus tanneri]KAA8645240.1 hypothetical protein ATNIH1004_006659 [Aspergillus tanneri]